MVGGGEGDDGSDAYEQPGAQGVDHHGYGGVHAVAHAVHYGKVVEAADNEGEGQQHNEVLDHAHEGVGLHKLEAAVDELEAPVKRAHDEGGEYVGGDEQYHGQPQGLEHVLAADADMQVGHLGHGGLALGKVLDQGEYGEQHGAAGGGGRDHPPQAGVAGLGGQELAHHGVGSLHAQILVGTELRGDEGGDDGDDGHQQEVEALDLKPGLVRGHSQAFEGVLVKQHAGQGAQEAQQRESGQCGQYDSDTGTHHILGADRLGVGIVKVAVVVAQRLGEELHGGADGLVGPQVAVVVGGGVVGEEYAAVLKGFAQLLVGGHAVLERGAQHGGTGFGVRHSVGDGVIGVALHGAVYAEDLLIALGGLGEAGGGGCGGTVALAADLQVGVHGAGHFDAGHGGLHQAAVVVEHAGRHNIVVHYLLLLGLDVLVFLHLVFAQVLGCHIVGVQRQLLGGYLETELVVQGVEHAVVKRQQRAVQHQHGAVDGVGLGVAPHTDAGGVHVGD